MKSDCQTIAILVSSFLLVIFLQLPQVHAWQETKEDPQQVEPQREASPATTDAEMAKAD